MGDFIDEEYNFTSEDESNHASYSASVSSCGSDQSIDHNIPVSLHWFRLSALRLHDNPALMAALKRPNTRFKAVVVLDPWFLNDNKKFSVNILRFLLECLHDLQQQLQSLDLNLYVAQGQTTSVLASLCEEWNVSYLTYQVSHELHSDAEERTINDMAAMLNIKVDRFHGHTLYTPAELLAFNNNKSLTTFKEFSELMSKFKKSPLFPIPPPTVNDRYIEDEPPLSTLTKYQIPSLQSLTYSDETLWTNIWVGGEREALKRLDVYCEKRTQHSTTSSWLFDRTSLSPYVRFGCISVRYFWHHVRLLAQKDNSKAPLFQELASKLLQREFYFLVAHQVPMFDCDKNNPICLPLPWDYDENIFQRWKEGKTGYPWIDAAMRQMQQEGWINHYLRESVATFLTRGDMWISWVKGKETFESQMLDYEPVVCSGCWMKSSASSFFTGPLEHYCPVTFGQQIDPTGSYIRQYIPELRHYPDEFIYCPWMAPLEIQQRSRCIIGTHYPHPMIDHMTAGVICIERLKSYFETVSHHSAITT